MAQTPDRGRQMVPPPPPVPRSTGPVHPDLTRLLLLSLLIGMVATCVAGAVILGIGVLGAESAPSVAGPQEPVAAAPGAVKTATSELHRSRPEEGISSKFEVVPSQVEVLRATGLVEVLLTPHRPADRPPTVSLTGLLPELTADSIPVVLPQKPRPAPDAKTRAIHQKVVHAFILYDVGMLTGPAGRMAVTSFQALGEEAIDAIAQGVNQSASIRASCPIMVLSQKLRNLAARCDDPAVLRRIRATLDKVPRSAAHWHSVSALQQFCTEHLAALERGELARLATRVTQISASLTDPDPRTRRQAANTLGLLRESGRAAIPALAKVLEEDTDADVRATAARALAGMGEEGRRALHQTLALPERRDVALLALVAVEDHAEATLAALTEVLGHRQPRMRELAEAALHRAGHSAVPVLVKRLKDPDQRVPAARVLATLGSRAADAVPSLVQALDEKDPTFRATVLRALARIGPAAVDPLIEVVDRNPPPRCAAAIAALGMIGPDARAAVPVLTRVLESDDRANHLLALDALLQIDLDQEKTRSARKRLVPGLIQCLADREASMRGWACRVLGRLGADAESAVPALTVALGDGDGQLRRTAAEALGRMGPAARPATPDLVERQHDASSEVCQAAQAALVQLGETAVPALLAGLRHRQAEVRTASHHTLVKIGQSSVPPLEQAVRRSEDPEWQISALRVLTSLGPTGRETVPLLMGVLDSTDGRLREAATDALGAIAPQDVRVVRALAQRLGDEREAVRSAAQAALGRSGTTGVPVLAEVLRTAQPRTRRLASLVLNDLGPQAAAALPALVEALAEKDAEIRRAVAEALGKVIKARARLDRETQAALLALLERLRDGDTEVKRAAGQALLGAGKLAVPILADGLRHAAVEVRRGAAEALARLGVEGEIRAELLRAVPALYRALGDADSEVALAAASALGEIAAEVKAALPALRKAAIAPVDAGTPLGSDDPRELSRETLIRVARFEEGAVRRKVLDELGRRRGECVIVALIQHMAAKDAQEGQVAHQALHRCLERAPSLREEEVATGRLNAAQRLARTPGEHGNERLRADLRALIRNYPRTEAAEKARQVLEKMVR